MYRIGTFRLVRWDNRAVNSRRATDHELRGVYRSLRAQFRVRCIAERAECYFGDGPIDYGLKHPNPGSFTVHHTVAVGARPDLELETSLWAPAHSVCNKVGQAAYAGAYVVPGSENDGFGVASEEW
jgi:hypothetical protein